MMNTIVILALVVLTLALIAWAVFESISEKQEEKRRKKIRTNNICEFTDGFSKDEFDQMVFRAAQHINRLSIQKIEGAVIYGCVTSITNLSTWNFRLDFNDYGHITGAYWIYSENTDSGIPAMLAENIATELEKWATRHQVRVTKAEQHKHPVLLIITVSIALCLIFVGAFKVYQYVSLVSVEFDSEELVGENYEIVISKLESAGFTNIHSVEISDLSLSEEENSGIVSEISIGSVSLFAAEDEFPFNTYITVSYHSLQLITPGKTADDLEEMNYIDAVEFLSARGFVEIQSEPIYDIITGWLKNDGEIETITIEGETDFEASSEFRPDAVVVITYHTLKKNKPDE